jgi:hypothetical protein
MPIHPALAAHTNPPWIVPASKMAHHIGRLKMGIATASVASVILAVEGYACAPQQRQARRNEAGLGGLETFSATHVPKTAEHAG